MTQANRPTTDDCRIGIQARAAGITASRKSRGELVDVRLASKQRNGELQTTVGRLGTEARLRTGVYK